jgi:transcriptional regulator with XRE-family HTH domain
MKNNLIAGRIKDLRIRNGFSQEEMAEKTGLSLRTIQRIENGESEPRGDSFKRIALTFGVSPDEISDWQIVEDKNILRMLNLSQLGFIAFPLIGIIIPLAIWILKKEKVKGVNQLGISILNFQISWVIILSVSYIALILGFLFPMILFRIIGFIGIIALYLINLVIIVYMTIKQQQGKEIEYRPSFKFLQ